MRKFKCHKVVEAGRIAAIETRTSDVFVLYFDDGGNVGVDSDWMAKHAPHHGGYFVRYEDGYTSYSPADAFEKGYSEIKTGEVVPAAFGVGEVVQIKSGSPSMVVVADAEMTANDIPEEFKGLGPCVTCVMFHGGMLDFTHRPNVQMMRWPVSALTRVQC